MIEAMIAIMLVALALAGVSQLLLLAGRQQRLSDGRRLANREAGNVMERVIAQTEGDAAISNLESFVISPETRTRLPQATLKILMNPLNDTATTEVRVEIAWLDPNGQPEQVELTAWTYAGGAK